MKRIIGLLALLLLLCSHLFATTYYVKPGGNNSSAGTSWATAWAHPNKGNGTMASGDTMQIAPKSTPYDTVYINPPNAATGWTVYACSSFTTYYETGRSTVKLSGAITLTAGWTLRSGSIWRYNATLPPKWNSLQDYNVVLTQGDSLSGGKKSSLGGTVDTWITANGMHWYDEATDSLFFRAFGNVDPNTVTVRASIQPLFYAGSTSEGAIKIIGLTLKEAQRGPVWIGTSDMSGSDDAPDSIWILHCNIGYGGDCGPANNPGLIYGGFSSGAPPATANAFSNFIQVRACSLRFCKSPDTDYAGGGAVDTYVFSQSIFDSNYVDNCKAGGFMLKMGGGASAGNAFANVIAFNKIVGGRGGIWAAARQDSLMIYGNIFTGQTYQGISVHSTMSNVSYKGRLKIFNNTFVNSPGSSGFNIIIAPIAESGSGINEVRYNVTYQGSTGSTIGFDVMGGEANAQTPVTETHWVADSNMYYRTSGSFACSFSDNNGSCSGTSFANWQACLGGYDVHSTTTTNPNFNNVGTGDYSRPFASAEMNRTYGGRTWTRYGAWQPPAKYPNPLNTWLDSTDTRDDRSVLLPGMDAAAPPDGDTLAIRHGWKIIVWSQSPIEATALKQYDPTVRLMLYTSLDHGLRSAAQAVDTTDPGNSWNTDDEYSHYRKVCDDSSKNYFSLFYHFAEDTKILLSPYTSGGLIYYDTVFFRGATLPISDDDSSSVVPDSYSSPYFTAYGTTAVITSNQIGGSVFRRLNYVGTPIGSKVTRVYPDFSNPLARWADMRYNLRALAQNLKNLGGTNNDVYGWGAFSDAGFHWDGLFIDNSADGSIEQPEASTLISGGNILSSRGVLGNWYSDSTKNKIRSFQKEYFSQITNYLNNPANWWDNQPRATAANFGTWTTGQGLSGGNPINQWFNDSNAINLKCFEFAANDKAYSLDAYETAGNGRSTTELKQLDSLARANDFYVLFSSRNDGVDTTVASGWGSIWRGFLQSNWVRYKTFLRHRGLFAMQPMIFLGNGYLPCSGGSGTAYQGLNYPPYCNDRVEVDTFFNLTTLPYMRNYNFGFTPFDSAAVAMSKTDASGAAVTIYRTWFRNIVGTDTTDTYTYYFPRKLSSWEWRRSGNHKVVITPPNARFKRLEYNGTLTTVDGAVQDCWIGDQLILSYTHSAVIAPAPLSPANGSANQDFSVTLDWSTIANASGYQYQVDDNSDFSSIYYSATVAPSTGNVSGLSGSKTYYWRVRSVNATDTSSWTAAWTFSTIAVNTWDLCYVVDSDTLYANLTYDRQFIDYYNLVRHFVVHVITDDSARGITSVDAYDGYFISETASLSVGQNLNNLRPTTRGIFIADRGMSDDIDVASAVIGPFLLGEAGTGVQSLQAVNTSNWITAQMSPRIYFDFNVNYGCYPYAGIPSSAKVLFTSTLKNWDGVAGDPTDTSYCYIVDAGGALATSGTAAGRRAVGLCFYPFFTSVTSLINGGYCFPMELLGNMSAWVFSDEANATDGGYNCYSHEQYEVNQGWDEFGSDYLAAFYGGRIGWDFRVGIMMFRLWNMQKKILQGWSPDSLVLTIPLAVGAFGVDTPPAGDSYDGFDLWVKAYEVIAPAQWHMPMSHTGIAGRPFETSGTPPVPRDSTWTNRQNAVSSLTSPTAWAAIDLLAGTDHAQGAFDSVRINATTFPNDGNQRFRFVIPGALLRKSGFNWIVVKSFDMTGGLNTADIEFAPNFFNSGRGIYAQKAELYLSPTQTVPLLIRKKKIIDE